MHSPGTLCLFSEKTQNLTYKWATLSQSHINEGIRDPIKAYEYMNKFYVEEGNKRVSVLKYFDAVSVPGYVTRILPQRTEQKENKIYYEYVDFYALSQINYIWFSRLWKLCQTSESSRKRGKGYLVRMMIN